MTRQLEATRNNLQRARASLLESWKHRQDEESELLVTRPSDPDELSSDQEIASRIEKVGERDLERLRELNAAIDRINSDVYGICEECGARVAEKRLRALPETRFCRSCAESE